jgi:hypothetical protein
MRTFLFEFLIGTLLLGCEAAGNREHYPDSPLFASRKPVEGKLGTTQPDRYAQAEPVAPPIPAAAYAAAPRPSPNAPTAAAAASPPPNPPLPAPAAEAPKKLVPAIPTSRPISGGEVPAVPAVRRQGSDPAKFLEQIPLF